MIHSTTLRSRRRKECGKNEEMCEQRRGRSERIVEVLVSTVKPVLEEQAEKLRERGYKAELEEYFEGPCVLT